MVNGFDSDDAAATASRYWCSRPDCEHHVDSILTKICQLKDDVQALLDRTTPKSNCVFYAVKTWTHIMPLCEVQYLPWRTQLSSALPAQAHRKSGARPSLTNNHLHRVALNLLSSCYSSPYCLHLYPASSLHLPFPSLRTRRLPLLRYFVSTAVFYRRALSSQLHQHHFVVAISSTSSTVVWTWVGKVFNSLKDLLLHTFKFKSI